MTRKQICTAYPNLMAHLMGLGYVHMELDFSSLKFNMESEDTIAYEDQEVSRLNIMVGDMLTQNDFDLIQEAGFRVDNVSTKPRNEDGIDSSLILSLLPPISAEVIPA